MDLGRHFYLNKILEQYAAKPASRTTLRQLVFFGKTVGRNREKILTSANYVKQELAVRIAHRIRDLQALPFAVMMNRNLSEHVYEKYWNAFETFRKIPTIRTLEENEEFCITLKRLLDDHLTIIPSLTIGIVESSHHLPPEQLDGFMGRMLRSRISRRVLAEQHIALSEALDDPFHFFNDSSSSITEEQENDGEHVGIIYTSLKVSSVVEKSVALLTRMFKEEIEAGIRVEDAAVLPEIVVDGALEARFAYIPEHLEYIMFELLKNSMMAVMRQPLSMRDPVCIRVTIVEGPPDEDLIIRISDCGGGLSISSQSKAHQSKRDAKRRQAQRVASRKRREQLEGETLALNGEGKDVENDTTSKAVFQQDDEVATGGGRPLMGMNQEAANATANKAGMSDPLIASVTSFSNIRGRLELEEVRLKAQNETRGSGGEESKALDETTMQDSPGLEKEGIYMGLRAGLGRHEERASGIDSWVKMEALRNVGRFKGTVAEQVSSTRPKADKGGAPEHQQKTARDAQELRPLQASVSPNDQVETGLGLPMTKIYTDFFGGSLSLRSLDGHGMDVFVRLPKLGTNKEAIEDIVL
ncbi:hypothetical protein CBS101457_001569 [Exobasidium rhododendri]|nr:hypothetical protein CBS101457_001569 [Exobasidium rhododendri]